MKKIMARGTIVFLFILFFLGFGGLATAVDLPSINKSKIRLSIEPGKAEYGEIIVENQSTEPRSMKVYLSDWDYLAAADGTKEFLPISSTPLSCVSWISFSPSEFTIPPLGKQKIDYSVKVPSGASGGYYAALFFESMFGKVETGKEEMRVGMNLAVRIATLFYIDVEGTVKRTASIENLSFQRDVAAGGYSVELDFRNTGNADSTTGGTFHIMNNEGLVISRGEFSSVYAFPGGAAKLNGVLKGEIPPGDYSLVFTVDLGKALEEANVGRGPVITKEAEISIGENGKVLSIGPLK